MARPNKGLFSIVQYFGFNVAWFDPQIKLEGIMWELGVHSSILGPRVIACEAKKLQERNFNFKPKKHGI